MPAAKTAPARPVPTLADATAKTRSLIEELQARLTGEALSPEPALAVKPEETEDELERQLQAYFERTAAVPSAPRRYSLDEIRARVINGVVERILAEWSHGEHGAEGAALRSEVIDRLTDRVIEILQTKVVTEPRPKGVESAARF